MLALIKLRQRNKNGEPLINKLLHQKRLKTAQVIILKKIVLNLNDNSKDALFDSFTVQHLNYLISFFSNFLFKFLNLFNNSDPHFTLFFIRMSIIKHCVCCAC